MRGVPRTANASPRFRLLRSAPAAGCGGAFLIDPQGQRPRMLRRLGHLVWPILGPAATYAGKSIRTAPVGVTPGRGSSSDAPGGRGARACWDSHGGNPDDDARHADPGG